MCENELDVLPAPPIENPYFKLLGRQVTIGLSHSAIAYVQKMGDQYGFSAEHMMEIYLRQRAATGPEIKLDLPLVGAQ